VMTRVQVPPAPLIQSALIALALLAAASTLRRLRIRSAPAGIQHTSDHPLARLLGRQSVLRPVYRPQVRLTERHQQGAGRKGRRTPSNDLTDRSWACHRRRAMHPHPARGLPAVSERPDPRCDRRVSTPNLALLPEGLQWETAAIVAAGMLLLLKQQRTSRCRRSAPTPHAEPSRRADHPSTRPPRAASRLSGTGAKEASPPRSSWLRSSHLPSPGT
jgi:hypothetical protein